MKNLSKVIVAITIAVLLVIILTTVLKVVNNNNVELSNQKYESFSAEVTETEIDEYSEETTEEVESVVEKSTELINPTLSKVDNRYHLVNDLYSDIDIALLVDYEKCDTALDLLLGEGEKTIKQFSSVQSSYSLISVEYNGELYSTYYEDIEGITLTVDEYNTMISNNEEEEYEGGWLPN